MDPNTTIQKTDYTVEALGNSDKDKKVRAIVLAGYPNVSKETLADLLDIGPTFWDWFNTLTASEALSGTQAAIWKAYNNTNASSLNDDAKKVRDYLLDVAAVAAPTATGTLSIGNGTLTENTAKTHFLYTFSTASTGSEVSMSMPTVSGIPGATISGANNTWTVSIPKNSLNGPAQLHLSLTGTQRISDVFLMNGKPVQIKKKTVQKPKTHQCQTRAGCQQNACSGFENHFHRHSDHQAC